MKILVLLCLIGLITIPITLAQSTPSVSVDDTFYTANDLITVTPSGFTESVGPVKIEISNDYFGTWRTWDSTSLQYYMNNNDLSGNWTVTAYNSIGENATTSFEYKANNSPHPSSIPLVVNKITELETNSTTHIQTHNADHVDYDNKITNLQSDLQITNTNSSKFIDFNYANLTSINEAVNTLIINNATHASLHELQSKQIVILHGRANDVDFYITDLYNQLGFKQPTPP